MPAGATGSRFRVPGSRFQVPGSPFRPVVNAMSIDVEDYFQVSALDRVVPRSSWDDMEKIGRASCRERVYVLV